MATVTIRSNRVMTRSSTRTSPHMSDHDDTEDCCIMENASGNLERMETLSHASYPTSESQNNPIYGGNSNGHGINNRTDSGIQSSSSVVTHSSSSSISKSSGAIPLPNIPSSSTTIGTDCINRPGSRSSQHSSISPAPIIITPKAGTPSVPRTTTSRRGGRSGPRSRSPPSTYRQNIAHPNSGADGVRDGSGVKSSQPSSQQRRRRLNGTITSSSAGGEVSRAISPKTPSSAAAAAAAAAKRLCDPSRMHYSANGGNGWCDGGKINVESYAPDDGMREDGSSGEYSRHSNGRKSIRSRGDGRNQWSSHKPHFPNHEFRNERSTRSANVTIPQNPSHHHHPHHGGLTKFGISEPEQHLNHHHQPHHNNNRMRPCEMIGRYDRTRREQQKLPASPVWNDNSGHNRYEDDEQDIDNSGGGSGDFSKGDILQRSSESYQENDDNETRQHHLGNEDCGGGLLVVNRIKSSSMGMQHKENPGNGSGGTSRVMGSPTPIHVPRASPALATEISPRNYPNEQSQHSVGGTDGQGSHSSERSSVFRTKACSDDKSRSVVGDDSDSHTHEDETSPHQLLLALRSPTRSFDERKKSSIKIEREDEPDNNGGNEETEKEQSSDDITQENPLLDRTISLSPQEPPQIQQLHNQRMVSNSLFFPQTPRTPSNNPNSNGGPTCPTSIEASPSFNLFDRSFDSPFINAETFMQSPNGSTSGAATGTSHKELMLHRQSFSPNCSPGQRSILTPKLPPRTSLSITDSPFLSTRNFSFSPHPSMGNKSNSNRQHNTEGTMSIMSTPRVRDVDGVGFETSPCGLSLGSVGDVDSNHLFGLSRKRAPPIMPSEKEMDKHTRLGARVGGGGGVRTVVLGLDNRVRHTSNGREGYNISPTSCPVEKEGDKSSGRGGTGEYLSRTTSQQQLHVRNCEGPTPPLSTNSNQVRIRDIPLPHHAQRDPRAFVPERRQNLTNSTSRHTVGRSIHRNLPDAPIQSSSSLERKKIKSPLNGMNAPHFYQKLTVHKDAFKRYTFLLPALKAAMSRKTESANLSVSPVSPGDQTTEEGIIIENSTPHRSLPTVTMQVSYSPETQLPFKSTTPSNTEIARRRLTSALCAFGGNNSLTSKNSNTSKKSATKVSSKDCIFRVKQEPGVSIDKSNGESDTEPNKRTKYEIALPNRYFENDNRISWDFEENPPIVLSTTGLKKINKSVEENNVNESYGAEVRQLTMDGETDAKPLSPNSMKEDDQVQVDGKSNGIIQSKAEGEDQSSNSEDGKSICSEVSDKHQSDASMSVNSDQPKMRYRCKLCGQPKQNHTCPYQQSLQRSIGITVYPAANAYTAFEPGTLAPTLSEMNNFVHGQDNFIESTPLRQDRMILQQPTGSIMVSHRGAPQSVTPESMHHPNSSALSTLSHTPHRTPFTAGPYGKYPPSKMIVGQPTPGSLDGRRKRVLSTPIHSISHSANSTQDLLFVDAIELRPEQYRIVSSSISLDSHKYPSLPLPYKQRKSLSDNLFALSKGIPQLTDECAAVLRLARERDMWDVAVAELMTQVIVVVHCPENDRKLDGLSRYLLSLGFAC